VRDRTLRRTTARVPEFRQPGGTRDIRRAGLFRAPKHPSHAVDGASC
jgi:hypothetical protein